MYIYVYTVTYETYTGRWDGSNGRGDDEFSSMINICFLLISTSLFTSVIIDACIINLYPVLVNLFESNVRFLQF